MVLLIDVVVAGIVVALAVVGLVWTFFLWLKERKDLKKKYKEYAQRGKEEMDDSPLVG